MRVWFRGSTQEVCVEQIILVDHLVSINHFNALVVDLQVFVHIQTGLVVEEELGATDFAHGRALAGIFDFREEEWCGWAVFVGDQISGVLAA